MATNNTIPVPSDDDRVQLVRGHVWHSAGELGFVVGEVYEHISGKYYVDVLFDGRHASDPIPLSVIRVVNPREARV